MQKKKQEPLSVNVEALNDGKNKKEYTDFQP